MSTRREGFLMRSIEGKCWLISILILLFVFGWAWATGAEETDPAVMQLKQAIKQDPNDPQKHLKLARIYFQKYQQGLQNRYLEGVMEEARWAAHLRPDYGQAHLLLSSALGIKGFQTLDHKLLDEAGKEYNEALRITPELADIEHLLPPQILAASAYLAKSEKDKRFVDDAVKELKEAIRLKPNFAPSHAMLGGIYYEQGKQELALLELKEASRLAGDDPKIHKMLGATYVRYLQSGQEDCDENVIDQGIKEYKKVVRLTPKDAEAHRSLAWLYRHQGL